MIEKGISGLEFTTQTETSTFEPKPGTDIPGYIGRGKERGQVGSCFPFLS